MLGDVFKYWESSAPHSVIVDPSCFLTASSLKDLMEVLSSIQKKWKKMKILIPSSLYGDLKDIEHGKNFSLNVKIFQKWLPSYKKEVVEERVGGLSNHTKYIEILSQFLKLEVEKLIKEQNIKTIYPNIYIAFSLRNTSACLFSFLDIDIILVKPFSQRNLG